MSFATTCSQYLWPNVGGTGCAKLVITENMTLDWSVEMLEESHRRPLFSAGTRPRLRLLGEPKSFPSGIVLLRCG